MSLKVLILLRAVHTTFSHTIIADDSFSPKCSVDESVYVQTLVAELLKSDNYFIDYRSYMGDSQTMTDG